MKRGRVRLLLSAICISLENGREGEREERGRKQVAYAKNCSLRRESGESGEFEVENKRMGSVMEREEWAIENTCCY